MDSRTSSSDGSQSSAFDRFHEGVQRWIWQQGWQQLRKIQESAADPILGGVADVIVAAPTAGGKTEAAFLPIASRLAEARPAGIGCLCISPLKALINDQASRLESLFERVSLPLTPWHGDVAASKKKKLLQSPSGALLITPESLEALFVLRGSQIPGIFSGLSYIVVDELHSFIGSERGRQLLSLLNRVELSTRRRVPRIALSATLGDMNMAAETLRPGHGAEVVQIHDSSDGRELRIQLRGYKVRQPSVTGARLHTKDEGADASRLVRDLHGALRGNDNLVFANSRQRVEEMTDKLRQLCIESRVPNEYYAHHGNLSREIREEAESRVKDKSKPTSVICTSTLELGIDIGNVESIAQVGSPPSVAALRQRLGRSGRKSGKPSILRVFMTEYELLKNSSALDKLRTQTVQSIAMVQLLVGERWCEPPPARQLHLSTLVQQILSLIAQHGGAAAGDLYTALCVSGPFRGIETALFGQLLRCLGERHVLTQVSGGELTLGDLGEKLVEHYSFYAAFMTPEEYRLVAGGRTLGTMPISQPLEIGNHIIFAGRHWRVCDVDDNAKVVELAASAGGLPPRFEGGGFDVHGRIREKMFELYSTESIPIYLDETGKQLLSEGRKEFKQQGLVNRSLIVSGGEMRLFPWSGDRVLNTLALQFSALDVDASTNGIAIEVRGASKEKVQAALTRIVSGDVPRGLELAGLVENKLEEKYDWALSPELLCADYASRHLDEEGAKIAAAQILESDSGTRRLS